VRDAGRGQDEAEVGIGPTTEAGPALRDAAATAARIADDEAAADAIRERLTHEPLPIIAPDPSVAPHLAADEQIHDLRRSAMLRVPGGDRAHGYGGTLYLTSRRLIHIGQVIVTVELSDIVETSIAGERLLVTLGGGEGMTLEIGRPRHLRVEIAAAQRALGR
jgi:hypothetical protein